MIEITIRDLHMKTGEWIRKAGQSEGIVVLDRKQPVARIIAYSESDRGLSFSQRAHVKGFEDIRGCESDSSAFISEDRDRA